MYKTLSIDNFRGFKSLDLKDLARINLVSGKNCVGKTTLLEAIWLHSGWYNPGLALRLDPLRGIVVSKVDFSPSGESPWDSMFHNFQTSNPIIIRTEDDTLPKRTTSLHPVPIPPEIRNAVMLPSDPARKAQPLTWTEDSKTLLLEHQEGNESANYYLLLTPRGPMPVPNAPAPPFQAFLVPANSTPLGEDPELLSNLFEKGSDKGVVEALGRIVPHIENVFVKVSAGVPTIHARLKTQPRSMPLALLGAGVQRFCSIVLRIANAAGGKVLIDEIENGLHYAVLRDAWMVMGEAAKQFNVQLFVTTHSFECISAAHEVFSKNGCDFRFHRLDRLDGGEIRAATYDCETLGAAIESNFEVR